MRPDPSPPSPGPVPTRSRILKLPRRRALALSGALTVLGLVAAACGGGGTGGTTVQTDTGGSEAAAPAPSIDFTATRAGAGIAAAGGDPQAVHGDNPCEQPGSQSITISYVGANLAELDAIGLEAIVVEEPGLVIDAYTNEVNFNGGVNGRCVEFVPHLWSLADPVSSLTQICADMAAQQPVFYFSLGVIEAVFDCATRGAGIPVIALYASAPDSIFVGTEGRRFFLDDGSFQHLLSKSLDVALSVSALETGQRVGLLHGGTSAMIGAQIAHSILEVNGLERVATLKVPPEHGDLQLLLAEKSVRLLESGLSDAEQSEAQSNLDSLPPEIAGLFQQMEQFYIDGAATFRDSGATAVIALSDWSALRRMMRAAELIDWSPRWIANDMQPATLTMQEAPHRQAENLLMVSSRRAAGDAVPEMDRGCVTLRNTATEAPTFTHRLHSDGWTLIASVCDYLDVAFSAMTRIDGTVTAASFIRAMHHTEYELQNGSAITFTAGDHNGADRFRILQADPVCVLNSWGCMRSITEWITPGVGSGTAEAS